MATEPNPNAARIREVQQIENLLPQITDRGAALYFLANRYAQLGDLPVVARRMPC